MSFVQLTDTHKPRSTELFLDTSIHCSTLKGSLFRDRISTVFKLFGWRSTSTYTKVEFGKVVLSNAEYYLRLLDKYGSLDKTLDHIGNVLPVKLHSAKVVWSFNLIRRFSGDDDFQATERARLSLKSLLRLGVAYIDSFCDGPLADGTKCYWATHCVQKDGSGKYVWKSPKCNRNKKRCRLDDFFIENREEFCRIKHAIDTMPEEQRSKQLSEFSEVIGKALSNPQILLDYSSGCRLLADAIIAVDGKNFRSMFSQNDNESNLLTRVLEQDFYYMPPNPDKGVLVQLTT